MRTSLFSLFLSACLFVPPAVSGQSKSGESILPLRANKETYVYVGTIQDGDRKGEKENMTMSFEKRGTNIVCRSTVNRKDAKERVEVVLTEQGLLLSAKRSFTGKEIKREGRITVSGQTVSFSQTEGAKKKEKKKSRDMACGLGADTSLLASIRTHPFGKGKTSRLQLATFSQMVIDAVIVDTGEETVVTPAGTFECYRVEVTFQVYFFRKSMAYWVTKTPPHFMVRHYGVRGRDTPTYDSRLEKITPALPSDHFQKAAE